MLRKAKGISLSIIGEDNQFYSVKDDNYGCFIEAMAKALYEYDTEKIWDEYKLKESYRAKIRYIFEQLGVKN